MDDDGFDEPNPPCPACGSEMTPDGVDTADGLESRHRCPRCKLVIVLSGPDEL
jgi:transposase-like protein